jgi:hypothetical protein
VHRDDTLLRASASEGVHTQTSTVLDSIERDAVSNGGLR